MTNELVRGLGRLEATTLVVGGIVGTTVFLITSDVARIVESPILVLVTWLVAGLLAGTAALCFAELSAAMPKTGGTYVFLKRAFGSDLVSFGYAWMMCFAYGTGAIAVVSIMAATYLMEVVQSFGLPGSDYVKHSAIVLIAGLTLLNAQGVKQGGMAQNIITGTKVLLIVALIGVSLVFADLQMTGVFASAGGTGSPGNILQNVSTAMILCLFSYSGAYFVTHVAEEVRDPQRNIPRSIIYGFLTVLVLYLSINLAYLAVMSVDEIKASEHIASDMMAKVIGSTGAVATAFVIFCSSVGVLNAQLLNYPRIPFAAAKDGLFFRKIAEVDPRTNAPTASILLAGVVASIYAWSGSYSAILGYVAFVAHFFICLAVLAVIVLRIREPDLERPYKVWGYPFTPIAFLLVSVVYLYNLLTAQPQSVLVGIVIVLAGLPFYWYWRKH